MVLFSASSGKLLMVSEEGNDKSQEYSLEEYSDEVMQNQVYREQQWE